MIDGFLRMHARSGHAITGTISPIRLVRSIISAQTDRQLEHTFERTDSGGVSPARNDNMSHL